MNIDILQQPGIYVIEASESQACDAVLRLKCGDPSCVPITLRGKKMRSEAAALDEISAALQFPYYFGSNWNSVDECLNDSDWMPVSDCVVVVSNFSECFVDELSGIDMRETFVRILRRTVGDWESGVNGRLLRLFVYLCDEATGFRTTGH